LPFNFASDYATQKVDGKQKKLRSEGYISCWPAEGLSFAKENVSTTRMQEYLMLRVRFEPTVPMLKQ
jgi:hypothetical protein